MLTTRSTYHRPSRRPWAHPAASAAAALALLLGAFVPGAHAGGAPSKRASAAAVTEELVINGAGDGHGVGMSQEGALGYAERGFSYSQILAHYYTGTAISQAPAGAIVRVLIGRRVHQIPLETYVRGVVAAEMPASWPLAALEAQTVASRTYALTDHAGGSRFDVYADTRSQVYRGVAVETPQTDAAVAATAGQIVTYEGRPAITYFFASSGGMTEDVENAFPGAAPEPWLRGVADQFEGGPLHRWRLTMSFATAAARLRGLVQGTFRGIEVTRRGVSPRIISAEILGSAGATAIGGGELAARLGLYATWASFGVRSASGVRPEPDSSGGRAPASSPTSQPEPAVGPQGGAQAPGGSVSPGEAGGAAAS